MEGKMLILIQAQEETKQEVTIQWTQLTIIILFKKDKAKQEEQEQVPTTVNLWIKLKMLRVCFQTILSIMKNI